MFGCSFATVFEMDVTVEFQSAPTLPYASCFSLSEPRPREGWPRLNLVAAIKRSQLRGALAFTCG